MFLICLVPSRYLVNYMTLIFNINCNASVLKRINGIESGAMRWKEKKSR